MAHDRLAPSLDPAVRAERERIARDLHDSVIQDVIAVGLQLTAGLGSEPDSARRDRDTALAAQLDRAATRLRQIVGQLHWPDDAAALEEELGTILTHSSRLLGFAPSLRLTGPLDQLTSCVAAHVAAVVQEGLSNVARHAHASEVTVAITVDDSAVVVEVTDDGPGLGGDTAVGGLGLRNLRARASDCGGALLMEPGSDGRGLRLVWRGLRGDSTA